MAPRACSKRPVIQIAVQADRPSGGALKVRDYYLHCKAHGCFDVRLFMPETTDWNNGNPFSPLRDRVAHSIDWTEVDIFLGSGWAWERFIPSTYHAEPTFSIYYLVQSFAKLDVEDRRFRTLAMPAHRICVSRALYRTLLEIQSDGGVNGPVTLIENGIDLRECQQYLGKERKGGLIVGAKQPDLARQMANRIARRYEVSILTEIVPRDAFLRALARAEWALFLPSRTEGFYLPALEAMALETPVICPYVRGNTYCNGANSLVVDFRSDSIEEGIDRFHEMPNSVVEGMVAEGRSTAGIHSLERERRQFHTLLDRWCNESFGSGR